MTWKNQLLQKLCEQLESRFLRLAEAARDAHAAATDPGSKAESKYDTRNLEASYLATGQARQVEELGEMLRIFRTLDLPDFQIDDPIDSGALVEVDLANETSYFLLAPIGGGLTLEHEGLELTVLSPQSPMYRRLVGLHTGDSLESPDLLVTEVR